VYTPPATGQLDLSLSSMKNQGLYVRSACEDKATELACANSAVGGTPETLALGVTAGTPLYVFVDASGSPMDAGPYNLASTFTAAVCGDDKATLPEECDDGKLIGADGCDAMCNFSPQSELEMNNNAVSANAVFEGKVTASITPAMENDWFKITVPGPMSTIEVTTGASNGTPCQPAGGLSGIDTEVQILGTDGMMQLAANDDILYMAAARTTTTARPPRRRARGGHVLCACLSLVDVLPELHVRLQRDDLGRVISRRSD
jgi:cysteine-rich repeat protein